MFRSVGIPRCTDKASNSVTHNQDLSAELPQKGGTRGYRQMMMMMMMMIFQKGGTRGYRQMMMIMVIPQKGGTLVQTDDDGNGDTAERRQS